MLATGAYFFIAKKIRNGRQLIEWSLFWKKRSIMKNESREKDWHVYVVECRDGSLYTGITKNLERRIAKHNAGRGARYTSGRTPILLKYHESVEDRSKAINKENEIKKMPRVLKLSLIQKTLNKIC